MNFSVIDLTAGLGHPRDTAQILIPQYQNMDEIKSSPKETKAEERAARMSLNMPSLRSTIATKVVTMKTTIVARPEIAGNHSNGRHRSTLYSRISTKFSHVKTTIATHLKRHPSKKYGLYHQPNVASTFSPSIPVVKYRDIDLGHFREVSYADTVVCLGGYTSDRSELNFDSFEYLSGPDPDNHKYEHASTVVNEAQDQSHVKYTPSLNVFMPSVRPKLSPIVPTSVLVSGTQAIDNMSRPTTGSTTRRRSGESLRHLQTRSTAASRGHSRQISSATAITVPFSEDEYEGKDKDTDSPPVAVEIANQEELLACSDDLRPQGLQLDSLGQLFTENSSVIASLPESNLWEPRPAAPHTFDLTSRRKQRAQGDWFDIESCGRVESDESCEFEEIEWLQPKQAVNTTSQEVECQKSVCLAPEERPIFSLHDDTHRTDYFGDVDHIEFAESPGTMTPDDPGTVTRSFGQFTPAFTQAIKDYSKLLDDLADPDATAQALQLVNNKLSFHLQRSSSTYDAVPSPLDNEVPEKRELRGFPGLDEFLGDDDSDFDANDTGRVVGPVNLAAFSSLDLDQFINDDEDFDFGTCDALDRARPSKSRIVHSPYLNQFVDEEDFDIDISTTCAAVL